MQAHTRVIVAASAYAVISGEKLAGLFDHAAGEQRRIAAECQGNRLQGADGERSVQFGGTLPEIYDHGDKAFVSLEIEGATARGYDRGSNGHYVAEVEGRVVQLYDYAHEQWFAFEALEF